MTICEWESQWEFAVRLRELKLVLHDYLEGWDGVGGGREAQEEEDMYTYGWFLLMNGRNQNSIIKQLSFN